MTNLTANAEILMNLYREVAALPRGKNGKPHGNRSWPFKKKAIAALIEAGEENYDAHQMTFETARAAEG